MKLGFNKDSNPKEKSTVQPMERKYHKGSLRPGAHRCPPGEKAFAGWVNKHGVEFPAGNYPEFHARVSSFGDVVILDCPRCRRTPMNSERVQGKCPDFGCGFSAIDLMDEIT